MSDRIDIDDLNEIAESIADELDEHFGLVQEVALAIPKSEFPFTFLALLGFIPKVESIRIGIFEIVEVGEFYSAKILFRAIAEHFLKCQYIFLRHIDEKSDDPGKDYFIFSRAKEELDFAKSLQTRAEVLGTQMGIDPIEILRKLDVRLKDETSKSLKARADQFTHRNIVAYVSNKLDAGSEVRKAEFLANIIPAYSELSSFVHGGPSTLRYSQACSNTQMAEQELRSDAALSLQMSLAVRAYTFLLLAQQDKRMFRPFQIVNKALKMIFGNIRDA